MEVYICFLNNPLSIHLSSIFSLTNSRIRIIEHIFMESGIVKKPNVNKFSILVGPQFSLSISASVVGYGYVSRLYCSGNHRLHYNVSK